MILIADIKIVVQNNNNEYKSNNWTVTNHCHHQMFYICILFLKYHALTFQYAPKTFVTFSIKLCYKLRDNFISVLV